jgi:ribosome-associated toxin RatA of RatAB toxin-antitoxin module
MVSMRAWIALGVICAAPLNGAAANPNGSVSMVLQSAGTRAYRLEGRFQIEASRQTVWDVLTDYGHMTQFVASLRRSEVVERRPHGVLLRQEALGRAWMFSRKLHVLLDVTEEPLSRLVFADVSHRDFEFYKGTWEIAEAGKDLEIIYRLEAKRTFSAPNFLAEGALRKTAENLLAEIRSEILRRAEGKNS